MSWMTESTRDLWHGESKSERRNRRAQQAEQARLRAIGPAPQATDIDIQTGSRPETREERKRRLRRLALRQQSGDPYGELKLGETGLLAA